MDEGRKRIRLQEEVFSAWEGELRALGLEGRGALRRRKEVFLRELSSFSAPRKGRLEELLQGARRAGAVLVGDYHTLPRVQRSAGRILAALARSGAAPLLLLECFTRRDEKALRAWNRGRIDLEGLRRAASFDEAWGFPWEGYADLLLLARRLRVPVLPLEEKRETRGLVRRERAMADRAARAARNRPGRIPFLLAGDLHLAREGLPEALEKRGLRPFRILQNQEVLYWRLAAQEEPRRETWLELDRWTWCLLEAHPLWKLQSAFAWLEGGECPDEGGPDADLSGKALELARALGEWLRIPLPENRAPLVFTGDPFAFLDLLTGMEVPRPGQEEFFAQVAASRLYIPPGRDLLYLAAPTLNALSEGAARWLRSAGKGSSSRKGPGGTPPSFPEALLDHALGWTGSLLFNPFRRPPAGPPEDFFPRGGKDLAALEARARRMGEGERALLARRLGERVGAALFAAMEKEASPAALLREAFQAPLPAGREAARILSRMTALPSVAARLRLPSPPAPAAAGSRERPKGDLHPED